MKARTTIYGCGVQDDLLDDREWLVRTRTQTRGAAVSGGAYALPWPEECRTQFCFCARV